MENGCGEWLKVLDHSAPDAVETLDPSVPSFLL